MKTENATRLKKIRDLLAQGSLISRYLADELNDILIGEGEDNAGLSNLELASIKSGRPIDAIKEARKRLGIGLKEAKDFVEDAAEKLGLFNRNATGTQSRWPAGFGVL